MPSLIRSRICIRSFSLATRETRLPVLLPFGGAGFSSLCFIELAAMMGFDDLPVLFIYTTIPPKRNLFSIFSEYSVLIVVTVWLL
jgi:hypothetical protein